MVGARRRSTGRAWSAILPSVEDDPLIWFGNPAADDLGRYLYDVLALVMCEMQKSDDRNQPTSFDAFRKLLYRHMDALADEANLKARARVIESRELKIEMELFLVLARH